METSCGRCEVAVCTLFLTNLIFKAFIAATPYHSDICSECYTNALPSPFGVTGP